MDRLTSCEINEELISILEELLNHGDAYTSAIELYSGFDGEEWEKKARQVIEKAKGAKNG